MKNLSTNFPLIVGLVVISVCLTAMLTGFSGNIQFHWNWEGVGLTFEGKPK